jgi:energy-converting hydrogenase Eha subunit C
MLTMQIMYLHGAASLLWLWVNGVEKAVKIQLFTARRVGRATVADALWLDMHVAQSSCDSAATILLLE